MISINKIHITPGAGCELGGLAKISILNRLLLAGVRLTTA